MLQNIRTFFANTSFHGFKFISIPNRKIIERILWILITTFCTITAVILSWLAIQGIKDNKTKIFMDSTNYPIWNYQFPAISVCNFNQISEQKAINFFKNIKLSPEFVSMMDNNNMSMNNLHSMAKNLIFLTQIENYHAPPEDLAQLQDIIDYNNITANELYEKLTPECTKMLKTCVWKGKEKRCLNLFEQVKTNMGFCCTFNFHGFKDHVHVDKSASARNSAVPKRISSSSVERGLQVMLNNEPNDYFAMDVASYGYKILVHYSYDLPNMGIPSILLQLNELAFISISPLLTTFDSEILSITPRERKCFFRKEKNLDNYHYTYNNCMLHCAMNLTIKYCSCVPFFYYNSEGNFSHVRVCNLRDHKCLNDNKYNILSSISEINVNFYYESESQSTFVNNCNCLPDCTYSSYDISTSSGVLERKDGEYLNKFRLYAKMNISKESVFRIYYDNIVGRRLTITSIDSWHNIFAIFGGIISLFTGFQFGCIFEFLYFLTIKPIFDKIKN